MKYIYNPVTQTLDETAKIGEKIESTTSTQPRTDSLNNKHDPQVTTKIADQKIFEKNINNKKPITSIDYINRMQHRYGEAELNESNKLKDAALAAANNNVDPNRPAFSDTDIIFASMDPQEALKFTGGHNKEKIKFMREIKAKVRAQDTYDKKKKSLADMPVRKTPVKDAADIAKEMAIYEEAIDPPRPDFTKRRDPDLDAGIAAILKKKL